ncbi:MAG TPA: (2Fe-2S)-binding protein [Phycisphaerae bacterium]|nr:(2Fe-2S)-binding protein [Phycisphaerae bacterium]
MPDANTPPRTPEEKPGFSRRGFLRGAGMTAVVAAVADTGIARLAKAADADPKALNTPISGEVNITLSLNGANRNVTVEPRTTLLSALRDRLEPALTGPKLVCNMGTCGACTVIMDGRAVYGCSVLAIDAVGKQITTVEGIGTPDNLSPVQKAMCEKDGMMCGFCTDGFVTAITAYLHKNPSPTLEELKVGIKGNFCRCGTYPHVFEAALAASKAMKA